MEFHVKLQKFDNFFIGAQMWGSVPIKSGLINIFDFAHCEVKNLISAAKAAGSPTNPLYQNLAFTPIVGKIGNIPTVFLFI